VSRQNSTGGKTRLGRMTKAGNREIRKLLVLGATSMVRRAGTATAETADNQAYTGSLTGSLWPVPPKPNCVT